MLKYKGYTGAYNFADGVFSGKVLNSKHVIVFEAEKRIDIPLAFEESIEDYLEYCRDIGIQPSKT
jgi:predicted HicB family RNase H-like nuclease